MLPVVDDHESHPAMFHPDATVNLVRRDFIPIEALNPTFLDKLEFDGFVESLRWFITSQIVDFEHWHNLNGGIGYRDRLLEQIVKYPGISYLANVLSHQYLLITSNLSDEHIFGIIDSLIYWHNILSQENGNNSGLELAVRVMYAGAVERMRASAVKINFQTKNPFTHHTEVRTDIYDEQLTASESLFLNTARLTSFINNQIRSFDNFHTDLPINALNANRLIADHPAVFLSNLTDVQLYGLYGILRSISATDMLSDSLLIVSISIAERARTKQYSNGKVK